jgi:iron complex transport system ATP-binding protein
VNIHPPAHAEVIALDGVSVVRGGQFLLRDVSWRVRSHERWVVLGPNGAGKTTMLQVASTYLGPTRGTVRLFGEVYGRVDVRKLRERLGYAGAGPARLVRPDLTALDIVVTGRHASFVPTRFHSYTTADWDAARFHLERLAADHLVERRYGTLSSGEKQRVLIARSLMTSPELLFLDEAMTGLDLGARERLVASLAELARDPASPAVVLVTHHVEEIPQGFGHIALMADGAIVAAGPIGEVLTAESLTTTYGQPLRLEEHAGRFHAYG